MVEYTLPLDNIFHSLADPTRRDILARVKERPLTVSEVARAYDMSLAAISKHLKVMEKAKLISKRRRGKERVVCAVPDALKEADDYLNAYRRMWDERFDRLEMLLKEGE